MTMICPICGRDTQHDADAQVVKCRHCLRSFQLEHMNTESQQQIAREAARGWFSESEHGKAKVAILTDQLTNIILSAIERATEGLYKLVKVQSSPDDLRAYELNSEDPCGYITATQPQRSENTPQETYARFNDTRPEHSEQQEWPEGCPVTPWDMSSRDMLMHLSPIHNAALTAERQRRCPNCDFYAKAGITLLDAKWLDPECHEGCQSLKFKNQHLSALAAIEKHNNGLSHANKTAYGIGVDLSLLHEHDAEVRKPLVDLLEEVLSATVDTSTYPDGPCLDKSLREDIKDALAKVKQ